jgi:hypothetical protein
VLRNFSVARSIEYIVMETEKARRIMILSLGEKIQREKIHPQRVSKRRGSPRHKSDNPLKANQDQEQ